MKNLRSLVSAMLAAILLLTLVPSAVAEPKEVVMWSTLSGTLGEALQDIVNAYNASQNNYFVQYVYTGNYNDTNAKLISSTTGNRPDICVAATERICNLNDIDGMITPLQKYISEDNYDLSDLFDCMAKTYTKNGEWIAVPLGNTSLGCWYNTEILEASGHTVDEIRSLEGMFAVMTDIKNQGLVKYGGAYGTASTNTTYPISQQGVQILNNGNGKDGLATATNITTDQKLYDCLYRVFELLQTASKDGTLLDINTASADKLQLFVNGDLFMFADTVRSYASIKAANGDKPFHYAFVTMGSVFAADETCGVCPGGPGMFVCNNENEAAERGAWDFIKFYLDNNYSSYFAIKTGYLPVSNAAYNSAEYQDFLNNVCPSFRYLCEGQKNAKENCFMPDIVNYADFNSIFINYTKLACEETDYDIAQMVDEFAYELDESCMLYILQKGK